MRQGPPAGAAPVASPIVAAVDRIDGTDREPRLSYVIARLDRLVRSRLGAALEPFGLSVPQYTVLSVLGRGGGLSNAQLARRAYVTPQAMHQLLRGLEDRHLVERDAPGGGAQVRPAVLTASGSALLRRCDSVVDDLEDELFGRRDPTERVTLRSLLERAL